MPAQIRIFIGYIQNKEIKLHLSRSESWKESKCTGLLPLVETHWEEKDYIGLFIPSCVMHVQIKEKEKEIKTQLQFFCPKLNLDKYPMYLFPQVFLG